MNWPDKFLMVETVSMLGLARLAVLLPFRWIAPRLGPLNEETATTQTDVTSEIERVGQAILVLAPRVPWRSLCLEQAIAGKLMLRWRGVPSTLYLGVDMQDQTMEAHAWLRCGAEIVTGNHELVRYTIISRFGSTIS